jgi:tetratricopeptide (TPR) repeat protein
MAMRRGARVLVGRCSETDTRLPFLPWVDAFRAGRILDDTALLQGLHPAWRSELGRLLPELGDSPALSPERADPLCLFEAIAQLVERLARRDPLLILFEDWHWADEMSLRLLAFMGRRIRAWRVLLIGTVREEETASHPLQRQVGDQLVRDGLLVRLRLAPLSRDETITLARHLLPPGTAAAVDEEVWRASEGNAFITIETARMLARRGPGDPEGPLLPGRVRDLAAGRLERLSPRSRGLVGLAAAIGRPFDFRLLQRAGDLSEEEAADAIEELVRRRILRQSGDGFDFAHDRIRDVAYEGLLPPQRRVLHRRVAESLEALGGADAPETAAALAFHFREAGAWAKAALHLGRFGEQAARGYAHTDAAQAFQQALDALSREPASPERDRHQLALSWRRAHSLYFAGQWRESVATLASQAAPLARVDDPSLAGPWHAWAAHIHVRLGDLWRARTSAERAIEEAARAGDDTTSGKAHGVLAFERFWSGRPREGAALGERSVALLEGAAEPWWLGLAHFYVAFNAALRGRFAEARDALGRLHAISDAIADNRLRSTAAWATGWAEALAGHGDAAIASCEQALGLATDAVSAAAATAFLGHAYLEAGDGGRAVPRLAAAVEEYTRLEFRPGQAWFGALLADAHRLEGRAAAAADSAASAHALAREISFPLGLALAQRVLGRLAGAGGARDEATRLLKGALETFQAMEAEFEGARTLLDLAAITRAQGDAVQARGYEESARVLFTRLGLPASRARAGVASADV